MTPAIAASSAEERREEGALKPSPAHLVEVCITIPAGLPLIAISLVVATT
jgi:hypothetical protein